ncbi:hypothetical protein [Herbihabitans rhizosphaerae]|uniref:hypothetical protein n=1 Tax=Herbihabitans rhizosphaerae TaxID=1872711 RepID=UPI00102C850D|nr:hypothetical protein [Herbihabitans rhizosphaerae]
MRDSAERWVRARAGDSLGPRPVARERPVWVRADTRTPITAPVFVRPVRARAAAVDTLVEQRVAADDQWERARNTPVLPEWPCTGNQWLVHSLPPHPKQRC